MDNKSIIKDTNINSKSKKHTNNNNQKYKSPSKAKRDYERARTYYEEGWKMEKKKVNIQMEKKEIPESTEETTEEGGKKKKKTNLGKKIWKYFHKEKSSKEDIKVRPEEGRGEETTNVEEEDREQKEEYEEAATQGDPTEIYKNFEINMQLSRLEEERTLTTALRHVIRNTHLKGKTITFPTIEAVDRIQLRTCNLPTDAIKLKELIDLVFKRREEICDTDEIYRQFVMTYGRITLDPKQSWPNNQLHTRHP